VGSLRVDPNYPLSSWLDPELHPIVERLPVALPIPHDPPGFLDVFDEIKRCLDYLAYISNPDDLMWMISEFSIVWDQQIEQLTNISSTFSKSRLEPNESARAASYGSFKDYHLYCMLLHLPNSEQFAEDSEKLLQLCSYILLAYLDLADQTKEVGRYTTAGPESCLLARQLLLGSFKGLRQNLPAEPLPLDEYMEEIRELESKSEGIEEHKLHQLWLLFDFVVSDRTFKTQHKRHTIITDRWKVTRLKGDPDALEGGGLAIERINNPVESEKEEWASRDAGNASNEIINPRISVRTTDESKVNPKKGQNLSGLIRQQRGLLSAISRHNQRLPFAYDALRDEEIRILVDDLSRRIPETIEADILPELEASIALLLTLFTGALPSELATMCLYEQQVKPPPGSRYFVFIPKQALWLALSIPVSTLGEDKFKPVQDLLTPIQQWLWLPFPQSVEASLKAYFRKVYKINKKRLFSNGIDIIEKNAKVILQSLNKRHDSEITLSRLSKVLSQRLLEVGGDVGDSLLLSGVETLSEFTPLFYQTTDGERLRTLYQEVTNSFAENFQTQIKESEQPLEQPVCHFGSPLKPARKVFPLVVAALKEQITPKPGRRSTIEEWITFHNSYQIYTVQLSLYSTGVRAVRDPLESVLDIDWDSGECFISDKEVRTSGNNRIVCLPSLTLRHMCEYRNYLKKLSLRLMATKPTLANKVASSESGDDPAIPFLFFLTPALRMRRVTPSSIAEYMENIFPVPVNHNRHYLRTHLHDMGCPGELLEAQLGHDDVGLEPLGRFSACSFGLLRNISYQYIAPLLDEDGWVAITW